MCLIGFALQHHPRYALVLAANRDEFYGRPAAPAGWWPDSADIFGGRDLQAGGSWLALSRDGRLAALTNFRQSLTERVLPVAAPADQPSRGALVGGFLDEVPPGQVRRNALHTYQAHVEMEFDRYAGFNLLLLDMAEVPANGCYIGNRANGGNRAALLSSPLRAGIHTLSNALLDTRWPKTERLSDALTACLEMSSGDAVVAILLEALADRRPVPDADLPDTGIGLERERMLAPALITSAEYGTRASTVVLVDHDGVVTFHERRYERGAVIGDRRNEFQLDVSRASA